MTVYDSGFLFPRTAAGGSSLVPPPPWHYSGELITVEFRADPDRVADLLPAGIEPSTEDPGAVALIWADWQSCSEGGSELLDPVRAQYREAFFVIRCEWEGRRWSRSPHIWVDKDFALVRGHHQGYPKKLGEMWMTRPVTVGRAGPRLAPGGRLAATLSSYGRRLAEAVVTLTEPAEAPGFVNAHPMLHHRLLPAIESDGTDALHELVTMEGYDAEIADVWAGSADLRIFDVPTDEIALLAPREIIGGFYHRVGVSWRRGTTLRRTAPADGRAEREPHQEGRRDEEEGHG